MNKKIQRLTVSGIFVALATILSFIKFYALPYGGSITVLSMLPLVMLSYMYGFKWGIAVGSVYGAIQALIDAASSAAFAGQSVWAVIGIFLLDFFLAFASLSLAGVFRHKIKRAPQAFALGTLLATFMRYVCHFVSGFILFGSWATWFFESSAPASIGNTILSKYSGLSLSMIYSLFYNGTYMIPEIIITTVAAAIIISIKPIRKQMEEKASATPVNLRLP